MRIVASGSSSPAMSKKASRQPQRSVMIGSNVAPAGVSPESFTHGSSAQRQQWLETGLRTGDIDTCDTFGQAGYVRTR